jgi:hypothetical protein
VDYVPILFLFVLGVKRRNHRGFPTVRRRETIHIGVQNRYVLNLFLILILSMQIYIGSSPICQGALK